MGGLHRHKQSRLQDHFKVNWRLCIVPFLCTHCVQSRSATACHTVIGGVEVHASYAGVHRHHLLGSCWRGWVHSNGYGHLRRQPGCNCYVRQPDATMEEQAHPKMIPLRVSMSQGRGCASRRRAVKGKRVRHLHEANTDLPLQAPAQDADECK